MISPRLAVLAVALTGCATADRVKNLEDRVDALEKKVDQLKAAPAGKGGKKATSADEAAANELYGEISKAVGAGDYDTAKKKLAELDQKYAGTTAAKRAGKLRAELKVIGKEVPSDWAGKIDEWYQGSASDVDLTKGTTLIVFWEVWCPHCRREVPKLKDTYEKYHGKGLGVVGLTRITKSATPEKVRDFIKEQEIPYPIAKENGELASYFNVSGIPAAALVKDGKIVWRGHPARLTDELLTKNL